VQRCRLQFFLLEKEITLFHSWKLPYNKLAPKSMSPACISLEIGRFPRSAAASCRHTEKLTVRKTLAVATKTGRALIRCRKRQTI